MRRHLPFALIAAAAVAAPVVAIAATSAPAPAAGKEGEIPSAFKADRASSLPVGLVPDDVATPIVYPDEPIVLQWSPVPNAKKYKVEVSSNAAFTDVKWEKETDQAQVAPTVLLPDGSYYWRVTAVDAAGTVGLTSTPARFAKTWPGRITGMKTAQVPGGASVTQVDHQPYFSWTPLPGATEYEMQVASGDQFSTPAMSAVHMHAAFTSPAPKFVLPDDSYQWRVRGRDPKGNPGPWSAPLPFTKAWYQAVPVAPADSSTISSLFLKWNPVPGAEAYEVQMTTQQFTFQGDPLKINATTNNTSFAPTYDEVVSKGITFGTMWWRVRPVVNGVYGGWSAPQRLTWAPPATTTATPSLTVATDSDTALTPVMEWTPVTGATLYRVDVATDPLFHNVVDSVLTHQQGWSPRAPYADNQITSGYFWRVLWGTGDKTNPAWQVDEALAPSSTFKKQTRVTLGLASGTQVTDAPLLSWSSVPGAAKYDLELSQNPLFAKDTLGGEDVDKSSQWGLGAVPGSHRDGAKRLADGTWYWRVRAVDGAGTGQTWSPVGNFTLTSPRPTVSQPGDGDTVIGAPLMRWSAVPQACGYDVQVAKTPSIAADEPLQQTAQNALVLTSDQITGPGRWYWRVRADYCEDNKGQWSPTRSFKSVLPPDFGLNTLKTKVGFGEKTVVAGALKFGGARVKSPTLVLERRVWPEREYGFFGTVKGDAAGRFAFRITNRTTAAYRLRWVADDTHPEGQAPFAVQVLPRVTFTVGGKKVARRGKVMVRGSVYPARTAYVQSKTSSGWETIRTLKLRKTRFAFPMTATLVPGHHNLRILVPGDQRLSTAQSKARKLFVYDRFVIKGSGR